MENNNKSLPMVFIFLGLLFISSRLDNDVWFLLNSGRYVVEQGIPYIEPFTLHQNLKFLMQQWLSAVIFWETYSLFGGPGLICLLYIVGAGLLFVLYRLTLLVSEGNQYVAVLFTVPVGILCCICFLVSRPQSFSMVIFLLELYILESYIRRRNWRYLLWLPVLSLLLINLQAAMWPLLLVFLLPYLAETLLGSRLPQLFVPAGDSFPWRMLLAAALLICLAGLVNPYGLDAMTYAFRSYGNSDINVIVGEMHALTSHDLLGKLSLAVFLASIIIYAKKCTCCRYFLFMLGTLYMAISAGRSLFLFLTVGLFSLAYIFRGVVRKPLIQTGTTSSKRRLLLLLLLAASLGGLLISRRKELYEVYLQLPGGFFLACLLLGVAVLCYGLYLCWQKKEQVVYRSLVWSLLSIVLCASLLLVSHRCLVGLSYEPLGKPEIDYLLTQEKAEGIRLWTGYNTGGYAEFRGIRCYMDSRAETFLKSNNQEKDIFHEYVEVERSQKIYYKEFLQEYDFNYVLAIEGELFYEYLAHDPDYELVFSAKMKDPLTGSDVELRLFKQIVGLDS